MKKWLFIFLVLIIGFVLNACNSDDKDSGNTKESEEVFTSEDIEKAEEILLFLDNKMKNFEDDTNNAIKNKEIPLDDEEIFDENVRKFANTLVIEPFLEKYKDNIVPEEFKGEEQILVYFNKTSSEPCSLGFCEYNGIEVMNIEHNFEDKEEYLSKNFDKTELVFSDVAYDYENDDEEEKKTSIKFVKSEDGTMILTQHPYLSFETIDFQELDKEFESIATDVPESEVEAEQAEYKAEVEETLAKFPELQ